MPIGRPSEGQYAPWSAGYVNRVPEEEILPVLIAQAGAFTAFVRDLPAEKADFRYAPGKWTVRESLQHINDTERIFAYRALRIARGDQTPLPGFEQDDYIPYTNQSLTLTQLADEFESIRQSNLHLFRNLQEADWHRTGTMSGHTVTVLALGYIIAGHVRHHIELFQTRYFADRAAH